MCSAVASSASLERAFRTSSTPAAANASAHPRPSPLEPADTRALFPVIPKSMGSLQISPNHDKNRLATAQHCPPITEPHHKGSRTMLQELIEPSLYVIESCKSTTHDPSAEFTHPLRKRPPR